MLGNVFAEGWGLCCHGSLDHWQGYKETITNKSLGDTERLCVNIEGLMAAAPSPSFDIVKKWLMKSFGLGKEKFKRMKFHWCMKFIKR